MTRYIGLDAHSQSCTLVVIGKTGRRLKSQCMETCAKTITEFVKSVPRPRHLCMEEGQLSEWLFEVLEPVVDQLVVVNPHPQRGNKNDLLDATKLAESLRNKVHLTPVYKAPGRFRHIREVVRTHRSLTHDVVQCKNRLNALCRSRGLLTDAKGLYSKKKRDDVLQKLPAQYRLRARLWCQQLDALLDCKAQAEIAIAEAAKTTPIVNRLATAPGIGPIRASYIVAIVVCPQRFRTSRQLWSYSGLAVVMRSSSAKAWPSKCLDPEVGQGSRYSRPEG